MRSTSWSSSPKVPPNHTGIARLQRSCPRLIFFISIIALPTLWLICNGFWSTFGTGFSHNLREYNFERSTMASSAVRRPFTINPKSTATGLFIFLHGLGDDGNGWRSLFEMKKQTHIKYVFPNAEAMPVSLNYGMVMPSWFDITSLDMSGNEDENGIKRAAEKIRALIKKEQEAASIPSNKVILGGFSMGGALALYTGLTHPEELGGLVLLSSWLPLRDKLQLTEQKCPIFQGHGDADPLVQTKYGEKSYDLLNKARKGKWESDPKMEFKKYKGLGHSSCEEELVDVDNFIKNHLPSV